MSKAEALAEYIRLVAILDDELVFEKPGAIEALLGHPVGPMAANQSAYAAARAARDADLVEVGRRCEGRRCAFRPSRIGRGWLSHGDLRQPIEPTKKPSMDDVGLNWPQRIRFEACRWTWSFDGLRARRPAIGQLDLPTDPCWFGGSS